MAIAVNAKSARPSTFADESWVALGMDKLLLAQVDHADATEFAEMVQPRLHGSRETKACRLDELIRDDPQLSEKCDALVARAQVSIVDRTHIRDEFARWIPETRSSQDGQANDSPLQQLEEDDYLMMHAIPYRLGLCMLPQWTAPRFDTINLDHAFNVNFLTARRNACVADAEDPNLLRACVAEWRYRRYLDVGRAEAEFVRAALQQSRVFDDGHRETIAPINDELRMLATQATRSLPEEQPADAPGATEAASKITPELRLPDYAVYRCKKAYQQEHGLLRVVEQSALVIVNGRRMTASGAREYIHRIECRRKKGSWNE